MSRNQIYILIGAGLFVLCAIGALLAGIFFVAPRVASQVTPMAEVVNIAPDPRPDADGNSMGDPNAPIKIEEFSDFQCPFCQRFHAETEPLLVEHYIGPGKVYFTFHSMGNWVSRNIGGNKTESQDAAMAAYCAGDQNKFWEFQDMLFANFLGEDVGSFTDQRLKVMAETTGLDMDQFNSCYESGIYEDRVQQDYEDGQAVNIMGTPSFLLTYTVNGETKTRLIEGAQPFSVFQQELEAALRETGAK